MKKLIVVLLAGLLPVFASAAVLNTTLNTGTNFPSPGGNTTVSGSCGFSGANSSVTFALTQNSASTPLASSNNLTTNSSGGFNGTVTFPNPYPSGSATLVATCNGTGDTINSSPLTFSAPVSSSFGLPSTSPTVSGTFTVTGACGASNGGGSVNLGLNSNGSTNGLGTVNLTPVGTFSNTVTIPGNITSGPATLSANCSNGNTFSSSINVNQAAVTSFSMNTAPVLGSNNVVSGNCSSGVGNFNGTVNFGLTRNGINTPLTVSNTLTDNSGFFNSTVSYPSNYGSGPATLVVTCPNGNTFAVQTSLIDPAGLTFPPGLTFPGTVPPVATPAAPVGGVAAGSPPQNQTGLLLAGLVLLAGLSGLFVVRRLSYVKR